MRRWAGDLMMSLVLTLLGLAMALYLLKSSIRS